MTATSIVLLEVLDPAMPSHRFREGDCGTNDQGFHYPVKRVPREQLCHIFKGGDCGEDDKGYAIPCSESLL